MEILRTVAADGEASLVIVTHDARVFDFADRIAQLDDGPRPRASSAILRAPPPPPRSGGPRQPPAPPRPIAARGPTSAPADIRP